MSETAASTAAVPTPAAPATPQGSSGDISLMGSVAQVPGMPVPAAAGAPPPGSASDIIARDGRPAENDRAPDPQTGRDQNPAPTDAQPPATRRKLTLADLRDADIDIVSDGQTQTMSAEEMIRRIQRNESANRRFEEAARTKAEIQEYQQRLSQALQDPGMLWEELAAAGANPAEIARRLYEYEQTEAALTPEQRRVRDLERQVRQHQEEQAAREQQAYARQVEANGAAFLRDFNAVIDGAGVPQNHPARATLVRMLASETERVMATEGRQYSKREAAALVANAVAPFTRQAPELTQEDLLGRITPEMVAEWQRRQQASRVQASPPLPREQARIAAGRPDGGQFAREQAQPQTDRNGRRIVNSISDVWRR